MSNIGSFWDDNEYTPWTLKWVLKEALLCSVERRLPKRLLLRKKVSPRWFYRLKLTNALAKKLKVGFGPVVEGQYNIGVRGSRIDPVVDCINGTSNKYLETSFLTMKRWLFLMLLSL